MHKWRLQILPRLQIQDVLSEMAKLSFCFCMHVTDSYFKLYWLFELYSGETLATDLNERLQWAFRKLTDWLFFLDLHSFLADFNVCICFENTCLFIETLWICFAIASLLVTTVFPCSFTFTCVWMSVGYFKPAFCFDLLQLFQFIQFRPPCRLAILVKSV